MASNIQFKRGTAATFHTLNPVLLKGEPGLETDTNKVKFGDGVTAWRDLPYLNPDLQTVDGGEMLAPPAPGDQNNFDPTDVDGLMLWMDATHADYIHKVSGKVSVWEDMSESRARFVQSLKANRPSTPNKIESQDVVTFDGVNDAMIANIPLPEEFTLVVAFRRRGPSVNGRVLTALDADGGNEFVLCGTASGASFGVNAGSGYEATQSVDSLTPAVYTLKYSAEGCSTRLNGLNEQNVEASAAAPLVKLAMGASRSDFSTGAFSGDVAEVVLYEGVLSPADLSDVEDYMMARWGIVQVVHPLLNGMKAFWRLNEEGGDRSDLHNPPVVLTEHGTVGSDEGVMGNAAGFTGGSNYLEAPSDLSFSGSFSASIWFKPAAVTGGFSEMVQNWSDGTQGQMVLGFGDEGSDTSSAIGYILTSSGSFRVSASGLATGDWHHAAMVYDSSLNILSLYINGALADQVATTGTLNSTNIPVRIGIGEATASPNQINFLADQVGLWDRVLSAQDVEMLYNQELGKEDFTADIYGDNVSLLLHMDRPANVEATTTTSGGGGGDPYFEKVILLLHMDGTNGSTSFVDSGPNGLAVTANGNAAISTADSKFGGASGYFDGSSYISVSEDLFNFSSSDWTVEFWMYPQVSNAYQPVFYIDQGIYIHLFSDNKVYVNDAIAGAGGFSGGSFGTDQWYHFAAVRNAGTLTVYVNGVSIGSSSTPFGTATSPLHVAQGWGDAFFNGYIDELRITKDVARYTSDFTPPTAAFQTGARPASLLLHFDGQDEPEASLLMHFDGDFGDSSVNSFAVTATGNAVISTAQSKFGGSSAYFGGNGDGLTIGESSAIQFGTGDFTIEFWLYYISNDSGGATHIIGRHVSNFGVNWLIGIQNSTGKLYWEPGSAGSSTFSSEVVPLNSWTHIAVTRSSGVCRSFMNGKLMATGDASGNIDENIMCDLTIGTDSTGTNSMTGYIDELRIVKGVARYTSNFTPPSAPFLADPHSANVSALIRTYGGTSFTDASLNDLTLTPYGNVAVSTDQSKFGGASMYFDGPSGGSKLRVSDFPALDTADFTIELWLYFEAYDSGEGVTQVVGQHWSGGSVDWLLGVQGQNKIFFGGPGFGISSNNAITYNAWQHVAVTRSSGTVRIFLDGSLEATGSWTANLGNTLPLDIGGDYSGTNCMTGYIDDLRITKGVARYTANFTPPTHAFPTPEPTPIVDSSKNGLAVTSHGNARVTGNQSKFGASGYANGAGNCLSVPSLPAFGTDDFTVEFWFYFTGSTSGPGGNHVVGQHQGGVGGDWFVYLSQPENPYLGVYNGSSFYGASSTYIALNTWKHVALTRSGNSLYLYIDGTQALQCGAQSSYGSNYEFTTHSTLNGGAWSSGYIDDLRIVKGEALYTADFTPPTAPLEPVIGSAIDPNFSDVSLLLHMDGADGSTTFTDSSGNALAVTANGNAALSTAQSRFGGASAYFDGVDDYLEVGDPAEFNFGADDFTVEGWVYPTAGSGVNTIISKRSAYEADLSWVLYVLGGSTHLVVSFDGASWGLNGGGSAPVPDNQWSHVALSRQGGDWRVFVNGLISQTFFSSESIYDSQEPVRIGTAIVQAQDFVGYIDEFRITKGLARYTANFTPPSQPFWPVSGGTSSTTNPPAVFVDTSIHKNEVTPAGDAYLNTTDFQWGNASGEFAGGHLSVPMSDEFRFGTGDFTIEFWGNFTYAAQSAVFSAATSDQEAGAYLIGFRNDANMFGFCYDVPGFNFASANIAANYGAWTHYAFVRRSGVLKMYVNGSEAASANASTDFTGGTAATAVLGRRWVEVDDHYLDGLVDDFRITKGVARYTSDFNPPSRAYPDPTIETPPPPSNGDPYGEYVTLLLHMDGPDGDTGFADNSYLQNAVASMNGVVVSTAQSKFGGASGHFDGNGSYLSVPYSENFDFGTGDFTVEFWVWAESTSSQQVVLSIGGHPVGSEFYVGGGSLCFAADDGGGWSGFNASQDITPNAWQHCAFVRSSGVVKVYLDGVEVGGSSSYAGSINSNGGDTWIGGRQTTMPFSGYIDDLRITNGVARYTANFVPPVTAFPSPFSPTTGGQAVVPTDIAGCDLWLDSTGDVNLVNGFVSSWADKSGNGRTATPFNYLSGPTVAAGAGPGGQDAIQFGDPNALDVTYRFNLKDSSAFVLVKQPSAISGAADQRVLSFQPVTGLDDAQQDGMCLVLSSDGQGSNGVNLYSGGSAICSHPVNMPIGWTLLGYTVDGDGNASLRANGVEVAQGSNSSMAATAGGNLWVGFGSSQSFGDALQGNIAEIAMFDHKLGPAALKAYETGVTARWFPNSPTPTWSTSLLLHFDGDFTDSSSFANMVTDHNGVQTSSAQSVFGGSSGYFDGSDGFLSVGNSVGQLGSGDFTVEFWIRPTALNAYTTFAGTFSGWGNNVAEWMILVDADASALFWHGDSGFVGLSTTISLDSWQHIAFVRHNGTLTLYKNGASQGSVSNSEDYNSTGEMWIGHTPEAIAGRFFAGYMDDFRVVKGHAVYTADFLPPTVPLGSEATLLLHMDGSNGSTSFVDSSPRALTVSSGGGAAVSTTESVFGGASAYFDGSGGYLHAASNDAFNLTAEVPFTIEFWMNMSSYSDWYTTVATRRTGADWQWLFGFSDPHSRRLYVSGNSGGGSSADIHTPFELNLGQWYHVAGVYKGGIMSLYIDGTLAASGNWPMQPSNNADLWIGQQGLGDEFFNGYIDEFRIVKGAALYTSNFTPPTGPFSP